MGRRTDINFTGMRLLQKRLAALSSFKSAKVTMHQRLSVAWAAGAEAFIYAAMQTIKVQTGMSAASYLALARFINRQGAERAIETAIAQRGKAPFNRPGYPTFPSGQRRAGTQGRRLGTQLGSRAYTFQTGSPAQFRFVFSFQTVVYQHAYHEFSAQTMLNGIRAFEATVLARIPDVAVLTLEQWAFDRRTVRRSISGTPTEARFIF